jgi:hypothetical protein
MEVWRRINERTNTGNLDQRRRSGEEEEEGTDQRSTQEKQAEYNNQLAMGSVELQVSTSPGGGAATLLSCPVAHQPHLRRSSKDLVSSLLYWHTTASIYHCIPPQPRL